MANEKHIFIGIGGQGVKTVAQIKAKVYEKKFPEATASKTRRQAMDDSYRFLFIDTDQRDIDNANKNNRESFEYGRIPFINPQTDLVNLGKANPAAIYYEAQKDPNNLINKRILEACSVELSNNIPDQPLSFGAGAFRIKSRIAFAHSLADFQSKMQAAISSLNDVKTVGGEDCIIYYWLVSSCLGGTGSGIFNDVLYHINQLHRQIVGNGDPQLVYTLFMPKVFIDSNATEEKYPLNAYAVFSELDAFKKMSYEEKQSCVMHRLVFNNDYNLVDPSKRYCPFYYVIPIDIQTDKGTSLGSTDVMCHNTAEMLYHLHNGQAGATFRSDIDNYMNDIMLRNHEEFLVPMGYVSLQKPQEQYAKYMRARFRRDILRSWLLCNDKKQATVSKEDVETLRKEFFKELEINEIDSFANSLKMLAKKLKNMLMSADTSQEEMDDDLQISSIVVECGKIERCFEAESTEEKLGYYKSFIVSRLWQAAENLIKERGLAYAYNAIIEVRKSLLKEYKEENSTLSEADTSLKNMMTNEVEPKCDKTRREWIEYITKNNKKDIEDYVQSVMEYVDKFVELKVREWAHRLKAGFCTDEKNDELSRLARHISGMIDKVGDMTREAVKYYNHLSMDFSDTALDVTTVYLPMLKTICNGNGWVTGNFFSKLYTKLIGAEEDAEETPLRKDLMRFLNRNIYAADEEVSTSYKVKLMKKQVDEDEDEEAKQNDTDVRFFANPVLVDRGNVSAEKIIDDFLTLAVKSFEKALCQDKSIQETWENRKISAFFGDLTNEEKDEVRRALNPALFFSYNTSRIDVTTKEEHIIFVAGSEELASEMLGYQKGNTMHRFEKDGDENTALVLKSKFGLSLQDYRIYDSLKMVYDNASFKKKYHFHHIFAQYLDKLTLDNLPYEVLPQHRTFVKMLVLEAMRGELAPLFYADKYESEAFIDTMYFSDYEKSFKIALPEAVITDQNVTEGKIGLKTESEGRKLFREIEGVNFAERFKKYKSYYYNERFGETADRLIQAILRTTVAGENNLPVKGEAILKECYTDKREALLMKLSEEKKKANLVEEKRLYSIFFTILREEYKTVNEFTK